MTGKPEVTNSSRRKKPPTRRMNAEGFVALDDLRRLSTPSDNAAVRSVRASRASDNADHLRRCDVVDHVPLNDGRAARGVVEVIALRTELRHRQQGRFTPCCAVDRGRSRQ